jgi:hypothetical protein
MKPQLNLFCSFPTRCCFLPFRKGNLNMSLIIYWKQQSGKLKKKTRQRIIFAHPPVSLLWFISAVVSLDHIHCVFHLAHYYIYKKGISTPILTSIFPSPSTQPMRSAGAVQLERPESPHHWAHLAAAHPLQRAPIHPSVRSHLTLFPTSVGRIQILCWTLHSVSLCDAKD